MIVPVVGRQGLEGFARHFHRVVRHPDVDEVDTADVLFDGRGAMRRILYLSVSRDREIRR